MERNTFQIKSMDDIRKSDARKEKRAEELKERKVAEKEYNIKTLVRESKSDLLGGEGDAYFGDSECPLSFRRLSHKPLATDKERRFDNPETFVCLFNDYLRWARRNPLKKREVMRGGAMQGEVVEVDADRPLTLLGFLSFIGISKAIWNRFKRMSDVYASICEGIETWISANQIEGGLVGLYDSGIVKGLNNIGSEGDMPVTNAIQVNLSINGESLGDVLDLEKR